MNAKSLTAVLIVSQLLAPLVGCRSRREVDFGSTAEYYQPYAMQIEEPTTETPINQRVAATERPHTIRDTPPVDNWNMSLEEAIQIALSQSEVMRDVGGRVVSAPDSVSSVYDPALRYTDPILGPEAALSAFDAQFTTSLFFNRNERALNNVFAGGGTVSLVQNTAAFDMDITKMTATGTQFSIRNFIDYDRNSSPANLFPSAYNTVIQGEVRHPFLQGGGLMFNRIAGPFATPGNYRGVLIARVNTDIQLADFETNVRNMLLDVEQAYWQLYFAYRDLDARIAARDRALETWRVTRDRFEIGLADREEEALAREQYFTTQAAVENALSGTATSGLVVTTASGVYTTERRLRRLLGLPSTDGRLIRPADEPPTTELVFDWDDTLVTALVERVELRRQKWLIKRRELELVASRNFRLMRLDGVARYGWRGFGDDLFGDTDVPNGSAFEDLFTGDLQEWQLGAQLQTPIGNRIGHTAVRNAELRLARERAMYREQELQISHELAAAFSELDRAYAVSRTNYNRRVAAYERLQAVRIKHEAGEVLLQFVLDAQRLAADADSAYYRSLVDYSLAIASLHVAEGTYLNYLGVHLAEGPWSPDAHRSAAEQARRYRPRLLNYCITIPRPVSLGAFDGFHHEVAAPVSHTLPEVEIIPETPSQLPPPPPATPQAGGPVPLPLTSPRQEGPE